MTIRGILCLIFLALAVIACKNDACDDIDCGDNGTCIEGLCNCEEGFAGAICNERLDPSVIRVTNIQINSIIAEDPSGMLWDAEDGTGPDIIYQIDQGNLTPGFRGILQNDVSSLPTDWDDNIRLDPYSAYTFHIFEVDNNLESLMTSIEFISYDGEWQELISLSNSGYSIELTIDYDFN